MTMTLEQLAEWESHFLQDAIDMEDGLGGNRDRWAAHLRVAASIASSCISQPQPFAQGDSYESGWDDGYKQAEWDAQQCKPTKAVAQGEAVAWAVFNDKSGKIDGDPSCYRSSLDEDRLLAGFSVRPLYARDTHPSRVKEVECPSCAGSGASDLHPCISCKHCDGCGWVADTTPTTPTGHRVVPVEPTEAALSRGLQAWEDELNSWTSIGGTLDRKDVVESIYKAMLSAAPDAGGV